MTLARAPVPWDGSSLSHASLIALGVCFALGFGVMYLLNPQPDTERRTYWATTAIGAALAFVAFLPSWTTGLGAAFMVIGGMTATAYFLGSNIKIRGRVYAYSLRDSEPESRSGDTDRHPDSYAGLVTAGKAWWLLVPLMAITGINIVFYLVKGTGGGTLPALCALMLGGFAAGYGYVDASLGYPVARRQYAQFALIALVTAGVFTVVYLAGYLVGKQWPYKWKRSPGRVHPRIRHEKLD